MISVKRYFVLLNLLLLTGIIFYGVGIFYRVTESKIATTPTPTKVTAPGSTQGHLATSPYTHYQPVVKRDLFNTAKTVSQSSAIDVNALKPTLLNLKLWGTVVDENRVRAYAVVEDLQTRQQGLYRPGDSIQNATVKLILREKIILNVDGKDEVLEMASTASSPQPAPARSRPVRGRSIHLDRAFISNATQDIGSLMKQVRITPHSENGQPAGLRVTNIKPGSVFRKIGLRNGDVLASVSGKKITSVEDMVELYTNLQSSDKIDVQVKRRNRLQTITYNIQ